MKNFTPGSSLRKVLLLFAIALLSCSFTNDGNKIKSSAWQSFKSTDQFEINYRYAECNLPSSGTAYENVYLQIINKTDQKIQLEWNGEHWYNEKCNGCEPGRTENHKTVVLNPKETKEGSCTKDCDHSLIITSKMLNREIKSELTDFNLRDITITPILK
jgi:hypothetical protein